MTSYVERIEAHEQGEHQDEYVRDCEPCLDEALSRQPLPLPAPPPPDPNAPPLYVYRFRLEMVSEAETEVEAISEKAAREQLHEEGWGYLDFDLVGSYIGGCIEKPADNPLDQEDDDS